VTVDLLYVAWNRLEFTVFSWQMLVDNTDWSRVSKLIVYDDTSQDGTADFLRKQVKRDPPVVAEFRQAELRSPPAIMNRYVASADADWFAKIDNDIVVPPGWLEAMLEVVEGNPTVELLGMEAGRGLPVTPDWDGVYRFEDGSHMGGVGLLKVAAFVRRTQMKEGDGRFGFTEWQHEYRPVRGWINPDLPVVSLDRVPFEPWAELSEKYVEKGWQRPWGKYHERADYWDWWPK
jgi:cellulose synthase/poly-beta-1,6-N-acetylglucosamine synthase-like glycosyltransferase